MMRQPPNSTLPELVLLNQIRNMPNLTRDHIAVSYSWALKHPTSVNWARVNEAIIVRWSASGLNYIKQRAWTGLP